jgi:ABC-type multidrug transport system ATPase subunit
VSASCIIGVLLLFTSGCDRWVAFQTVETPGLLFANGRIEGRLTTVTPKSFGRVVELRADEGQPVTTGQVLVVLDDEAQRQRVRAAEETLSAVQQRLRAADTQLALLRRQVALDIAQATAAVREAQAKLERARANAEQAAKDAQRYAQLAEEEVVPPQTAERTRLQAVVAEKAQREAEEGKVKADAQLTLAQLGHQQIQAQSAERDALARQVEQARAALAEQESYVRDFTIRSPLHGTILARTVEENIAFFRDLRQIPAAQFRANRDRLLEMTRLAPFLTRPAGQLSGGMRQKLTLICTLIHLPDILLLDEPTTGVDPISRRDFWTIIHELVTSRGVTVLLTTSYMDEAERCHRVALLHEGAIVAQGAPEELTAALPGRVLAVSGAAPEQLLPTLSAWPAAESVALFGREVHLLVRDGPEEVAAWLEAAGVREAQSREIVAGLEDVFVHHLLTRRDAAATPQSGATVVTTHAELITGAAPIAAHELICRFGDFVAVDRVTLEVQAGEIFGLLGAQWGGQDDAHQDVVRAATAQCGGRHRRRV